MESIRKKKGIGRIFKVTWPVLALAVLLFFFAGVSNLASGSSENELQQLEDSLRRAAVSCYATNGVYPEDLDYIVEHYGVQIDENKFFVDYTIFGSNIFPDITVIRVE